MSEPFSTPKDNELLYCAERAATGSTESGQIAVDQLRAVGPKGLARLQELADEEEQARSGRRASFYGVAGAAALGLAVLACVNAQGVAMAGALVLALLGALFGSDLLGESTTQRQVAAALIAVDDPEAAMPLISSLKYVSGQTRRNVIAALTRLLPKLGNERWIGLRQTDRAQLYQQMNMAQAMRDPDFVIAILEALRLFGGREALPRVAWLVVSEAPTAHEQQVREAARVCLDYMRRRIDFGTVGEIGPNATLFNLQRDSSANWDTLIDARLALTHLLPHLQAADAALLSAEERRALHFSLMWGWDSYGNHYSNLGPEFHLELLSALARIGDTQALPYVRDVAFGEAATPDAQRIRADAKVCLQTLEEKAAREQVGQTLLRASAAPETIGTTLLRPATGSPRVEARDLLRAVEGEDRIP